MAFIEGYVLGLAMIIFIGPVFFLLINTSIQSGPKTGVAVALGIIVSDGLCVALCWYGLTAFVNVEQHKFWIGLIGSVILLILGISYLVKKAKVSDDNVVKTRNLYSFFLKGFSVNFFNPFVFVIWIGIYNYAKLKYESDGYILVFLLAALLGVLTTDLLKVFLSKKIKNRISVKKLAVFFKVTGVVLIIFSLRLLYLVW